MVHQPPARIRSLFSPTVAVWAWTVATAAGWASGCIAAPLPRLVSAQAGSASWFVEIHGAAADSDVFVDHVNRNPQCRSVGQKLRCHFRALIGAWPHRLEVQTPGGPTLRCVQRKPAAKAICKVNGFPRGKKKWYLRADAKITSGFGRRGINGHRVARRLNTLMYAPSSLLVTIAPRPPRRSWQLFYASALERH
jgi:hypothetical protein